MADLDRYATLEAIAVSHVVTAGTNQSPTHPWSSAPIANCAVCGGFTFPCPARTAADIGLAALDQLGDLRLMLWETCTALHGGEACGASHGLYRVAAHAAHEEASRAK